VSLSLVIFPQKFSNVKSENFVSRQPRWPEQVQLPVTTEIHGFRVSLSLVILPPKFTIVKSENWEEKVL
jgi:hypothetical protein